MSRILAKPWNYPPGQSKTHRLVKIIDLDPGTDWETVKKYFDKYKIEKHYFFGTQGLVQFNDPNDAAKFLVEHNYYIEDLHATVTFSSLPHVFFPRGKPKSRVICIQIIRIRAYVGIHDIFEECSNFGKVLRIICFEKIGWYALVEMETEEQAAMVFANVQNSGKRFAPNFELRVQYSMNEKINLTTNNSKSFDFTLPGAYEAFDLVSEGLTGEVPFYPPDKNEVIPKQLDLFRPVQFDPAFGNSLNVTKMPPKSADFLRNLFSQYGVVLKVKTVLKEQEHSAFIQMRTGFFARLAMIHLNMCPINGKKIRVEISSHRDVHPETSAQNGQLEYKEYEEELEDPDLTAYSQMWCPSQYVGIRPNELKITDLGEVKGAEVDVENNYLKFKTVEEAALFIGNTTMKPQDDVPTVLFFKKPPSIK